jgi:cell wall-associated protease
MAAPVVTGLAAALLSYYPDLSARQLKEIIMKSAKPIHQDKVNLPGSQDETISFSELSKTGGLVDAYGAFLLAEKIKGEVKKKKKGSKLKTIIKD